MYLDCLIESHKFANAQHARIFTFKILSYISGSRIVKSLRKNSSSSRNSGNVTRVPNVLQDDARTEGAVSFVALHNN